MSPKGCSAAKGLPWQHTNLLCLFQRKKTTQKNIAPDVFCDGISSMHAVQTMNKPKRHAHEAANPEREQKTGATPNANHGHPHDTMPWQHHNNCKAGPAHTCRCKGHVVHGEGIQLRCSEHHGGELDVTDGMGLSCPQRAQRGGRLSEFHLKHGRPQCQG